MGRQVGQNYTDYNVIIDCSVKVFFFRGVGGRGVGGGASLSLPHRLRGAFYHVALKGP